MKIWYNIILLSFLFNMSCSGVILDREINILNDKSVLKTDEFINSFSDSLKKNGYSVDIIQVEDRRKNDKVVRDGHGIYPILLEAKKENFSATLIVRVCDNSEEGPFVYITQGTFLIREPEKSFKTEYNKICQILKNKFLNLTFDCVYQEFPR